MQPEPPASAGPRVSDEQLAREVRWWESRTSEQRALTARLTLDLVDSRTALAAANARIAVLEAERDAQFPKCNLCGAPMLPDDPNYRIYVYGHCVKHVKHLHGIRVATASPDPGAAHE